MSQIVKMINFKAVALFIRILMFYIAQTIWKCNKKIHWKIIT